MGPGQDDLGSRPCEAVSGWAWCWCSSLRSSACGGSDGSTSSGDSATTAAAAVPDSAGEVDGADSDAAPADEAASDEDDTGSSGGSGAGLIQIGDQQFDLTVTRCITMAGALGGDAVGAVDPGNLQASFTFSPEGWQERDASEGWSEDGDIGLDSDEPYFLWETGQSSFEGLNLPGGLDPTMLDITSYDIADDGQSVRGEAMFIELNEMLAGTMLEPIAGSFEFSCPPAG